MSSSDDGFTYMSLGTITWFLEENGCNRLFFRELVTHGLVELADLEVTDGRSPYSLQTGERLYAVRGGLLTFLADVRVLEAELRLLTEVAE